MLPGFAVGSVEDTPADAGEAAVGEALGAAAAADSVDEIAWTVGDWVLLGVLVVWGVVGALAVVRGRWWRLGYGMGDGERDGGATRDGMGTVLLLASFATWLAAGIGSGIGAEIGRAAGASEMVRTGAAVWMAGLVVLGAAVGLCLTIGRGWMAAEVFGASKGWSVRREGRGLLAGLAGWGAVQPWLFGVAVLMGWLAAVVAGLLGRERPDGIAHETLRELAESGLDAGSVLVVLGVVVAVPVFEEVVFRGFLHSGLRVSLGGRRWAAVLIGSAIFAVAHVGAAEVHALGVLFAVGVVLGVARERSGGLAAPIAIHGLFNATNVVVAVV